MSTQVLGTYSFVNTPDVGGSLILTAGNPISGTAGSFTTITTTGAITSTGAPMIQYVHATGTSDVIVVTYSPAVPSLFDGLMLQFGATAANTTPTPTINVNGLGAKTIVKQNNNALVAGDISGSNARSVIVYNATSGFFNLINPASCTMLTGTITNSTVDSTTVGATTRSTGAFSYIGAGGTSNTANYITVAAGTSAIAPIQLTSGVNQTTVAAGDIEFDGVALYKTSDTTNGRTYVDGWEYFRLSAAGSAISTIADFFGTNDGIPLVTSGIYEIEWHCFFTQSGGANTATWTVVSTNALQTLTGEYIGSPIGGIGTVGTPQTAGISTTASTSTAFPVTGNEANATHYFTVRVMLQANAGTGGNTRLRLTMGGGTATPQINSYFKVRRLPAANTGTFVA